MPLTAPLVILGQLAAAAFAAGLNLYLTVALVGITSRLGWIPALPPGLKGLESTVLIVSAVVLYLIEFVIDKLPHFDTVWDALHTVIRPVAAALLVALAVAPAPLAIQLGAAMLAGAIALAAHASKAGLRLLLNVSPRKFVNPLISTLEDLCAAALAVLALRSPVPALTAFGAAAAVLVLLGPRLWRATGLAARACYARLRAFFGERGWHSTRDLPASMRALLPPLQVGRGEPRALRAAVKGVPGVAAYRSGWLVLCYGQAQFLYRARFRCRSSAIPPLTSIQLRRGPWTDAIDFALNGKRATIILLKDGPTADVAAADLREIA